MDPTAEEFTTMVTVGAVLNWVPVREPLRTSIMGALHIYDDAPVRILAALPGEVIQEALDFFITHDLWVLLVIEKDELTDPVEIGLLGAVTILPGPDLCADRLQKR